MIKQISILSRPDLIDFAGSIHMIESFDCTYAIAQSINDLDISNSDLLLVDEQLYAFDELNDYFKKSNDVDILYVLLTERESAAEPASYYNPGINDIILLPFSPNGIAQRLQNLLTLQQLHADKIRCNHQYQADKKVAAGIFNKIINEKTCKTTALTSNFSDTHLCNGDLFIACSTPENHLNLLLGDFAGQGMASLLVASPVAMTFLEMSKKGFSILEIVEEINTKVNTLLPIDLFLAASLIAVNPDSRSMLVINCGMQDHFLVDFKKQKIELLPSHNPPLGIQQTISIESQKVDVDEHQLLTLMSENMISTGMEHMLASCLANTHELSDPLNELKQTIIDHHADNDSLFAMLHCDINNIPWKEAPSSEQNITNPPIPWKTMLEFRAESLQHVNPVPIIMNTIMEIQGLQNVQQDIFIILTELFANALDHGVLGLESSIKSSPEGFMAFYDQKTKRLQTLTSGYIRIVIQHLGRETGGQLIIKMTDSGEGFDYQTKQEQSFEENRGYSGRGLNLLKSLCSEIRYHGKGNRVTAIFEWQQQI